MTMPNLAPTPIPTPTTGGHPSLNVTVVPSFPPSIVNVRPAEPDHWTALTTLGAGLIGVIGTLVLQKIQRRAAKEDSIAQAEAASKESERQARLQADLLAASTDRQTRLQAELLAASTEKTTRLQAELVRQAELFNASRAAAKSILPIISELEAQQRHEGHRGPFERDYLESRRQETAVLAAELPTETASAIMRSFEMLSWADDSYAWSSEPTVAAFTGMVLSEMRRLLGNEVRGENATPDERWQRADGDLREYHDQLGREYEEQMEYERQERERRKSEMEMVERAGGESQGVAEPTPAEGDQR